MQEETAAVVSVGFSGTCRLIPDSLEMGGWEHRVQSGWIRDHEWHWTERGGEGTASAERPAPSQVLSPKGRGCGCASVCTFCSQGRPCVSARGLWLAGARAVEWGAMLMTWSPSRHNRCSGGTQMIG